MDVSLDRRKVLRHVEFDVGTGVTGLVGRNGAGKTTLLRAMTGLVHVDSGVVLRDGQDISSPSTLRAHRRDMGWLPQEPGLPGRMRVEEFVQYAAWLKEVPASRRDRAAADALEAVDMTALRRRAIGRLSGGERRRAALAAAIVNRPALLLLDEPTVGLDPVQRQFFLEMVHAYSKERAVVVATHLLEDLELCADRWCCLDGGRVSASAVLDRTSTETLRRGLAEIRHALTPESIG